MEEYTGWWVKGYGDGDWDGDGYGDGFGDGNGEDYRYEAWYAGDGCGGGDVWGGGNGHGDKYEIGYISVSIKGLGYSLDPQDHCYRGLD